MREQWIPGHSFFLRGLGTRLEPVYTQAVCGIARGANWFSQVVIDIRPFHPPMLPVHTIHSHIRLLQMNFISVLQVISNAN